MLSCDGYECGKRCYSDQHNSTLSASEMLLTGASEHSNMNGKSAMEEKFVRLQSVWQVMLYVKHWASVIDESMYMSRLSHDKHHL
jgi:hypothetical protein